MPSDGVEQLSDQPMHFAAVRGGFFGQFQAFHFACPPLMFCTAPWPGFGTAFGSCREFSPVALLVRLPACAPIGHHGKAAPSLTWRGRLHRCIQRQEIGLVGDFADHAHHAADFYRAGFQLGQRAVDSATGVADARERWRTSDTSAGWRLPSSLASSRFISGGQIGGVDFRASGRPARLNISSIGPSTEWGGRGCPGGRCITWLVVDSSLEVDHPC